MTFKDLQPEWRPCRFYSEWDSLELGDQPTHRPHTWQFPKNVKCEHVCVCVSVWLWHAKNMTLIFRRLLIKKLLQFEEESGAPWYIASFRFCVRLEIKNKSFPTHQPKGQQPSLDINYQWFIKFKCNTLSELADFVISNNREREITMSSLII